MRKLTFLLLALMGFSTLTMAQAKKKALETLTIKTPSVQCDMCKDRIEKFMAREEGVTKTVVDYKKKGYQSNLLDRQDELRKHKDSDSERRI